MLLEHLGMCMRLLESSFSENLFWWVVQFSFKVVSPDSCEDENLDAAPSVDVVEWLDPVDPVQLGTQGQAVESGGPYNY